MTTKNSPEPSTAWRAGLAYTLSFGFGPVDQDLNVVGATIEDQNGLHDGRNESSVWKVKCYVRRCGACQCVLLNMADRDGFNTAYMRYFHGRMPTRRLIGAGDL